MCCFDKMLLSAVVQCFQQEMLECSSSSVSSVGFIVQLSKWLNLHLAVEPIVFSVYTPFVICLGTEKRGKRKRYLKLGGCGSAASMSNVVCLKIILKYLYHEIQSGAMTAFWKEMYLHAL